MRDAKKRLQAALKWARKVRPENLLDSIAVAALLAVTVWGNVG